MASTGSIMRPAHQSRIPSLNRLPALLEIAATPRHAKSSDDAARPDVDSKPQSPVAAASAQLVGGTACPFPMCRERGRGGSSRRNLEPVCGDVLR